MDGTCVVNIPFTYIHAYSHTCDTITLHIDSSLTGRTSPSYFHHSYRVLSIRWISTRSSLSQSYLIPSISESSFPLFFYYVSKPDCFELLQTVYLQALCHISFSYFILALRSCTLYLVTHRILFAFLVSCLVFGYRIHLA
ncbi:hypothetical protein F5051DRAFT_65398 [Lentinula edodes]|nr:hypothetical protein F5051DRAFT_65398 [Lentinula edodes]